MKLFKAAGLTVITNIDHHLCKVVHNSWIYPWSFRRSKFSSSMDFFTSKMSMLIQVFQVHLSTLISTSTQPRPEDRHETFYDFWEYSKGSNTFYVLQRFQATGKWNHRNSTHLLIVKSIYDRVRVGTRCSRLYFRIRLQINFVKKPLLLGQCILKELKMTYPSIAMS